MRAGLAFDLPTDGQEGLENLAALWPPKTCPRPLVPSHPPPTFAGSLPGIGIWVLTHLRNLVSHSMTDGISAYAGELR